MQNNFIKCLDFTLLPDNDGQPIHKDANDSGGWTSYGITLATYQQYFGNNKTVNDLKNMTQDQIQTIYKSFWNSCHCDDLHNGVDLMVFDFAVNAGIKRSSTVLQKSINSFSNNNIDVDGIIGKNTISCANAINDSKLIDALLKEQEDFYKSLKAFKYFGNGWLRRLNDKYKVALSMI